MATKWVVMVIVLTLSGMAVSTHFRGAIIQWRPLDAQNFNGTIVIRHRVAWTRDYGPLYECSEADKGTTRLFGNNSDTLECQLGCSGTVGTMQFYCTDIDISENWVSGERAYLYDIGTSVTYFEAAFSGHAWILNLTFGGGGGWEIRVKGNLAPRSDNGLVNSSPVSTTKPVVQLQYGCSHDIRIPVQDADQDTVRCRWARGNESECAAICNGLPDTSVQIDEDTCVLTWNASTPTGLYPVAIQIEDFMTSLDTTPMSSVPLQFIIEVVERNEPCTGGIRPSLVPGETPPDGACIAVSFGTTYSSRIVAYSGDNSVNITHFQTSSPNGLMVSPVTQSQLNSTYYYVNITWTSIENQFGQVQELFCFNAVNSIGLETMTSCITLLSGVTAPTAQSSSVSPTGTFTPTASTIWNITFDQIITRPSSSRFIRFYETSSGRNVYNFDVTSSAANFQAYIAGSGGMSLTFSFSASFTAGLAHYVLLDSGVAVGNEFCHPESTGVANTTFWTFTTDPLLPTNIVVSTVDGDPYSLYVTWAPPTVPDGYITSYTVYCQQDMPTQGQNIASSTVDGNILNATVTGLTPFSNHSCYVSANTSIGRGSNSTPILQTTDESIPAGPPTNLQVSVVNATSVSLSWSPPVTPYGNIVSYTVMVQDTNLMVLNVTMASVTVENLLPNRNYSFSVAASTRVGTGPYGVITAMTSEAIPSGPPTNITSTALTASSISLSWDLPLPGERNGVITGYVINITNLDTEVIQNVSSTATIDNLRPFTVYVIKIAARTAAGIGPFSGVVSVQTFEDVPSGPPQMFNGSVNSPRSITFSWTAPPEDQQNGEITNYTLSINETESGVTVLQRTVPSSQTNITITSLQPFTSYSAVIAASTSVGLGPFSTVLSVMTPEDIPAGPPTNLQASNVTATSVSLSWSPPVTPYGHIVSYTVMVQDTNLNVTMTSVTVENLLPNRNYSFSVAASTRVGTGPYGVATAMTSEAIPSGPPTNITSTVQTASSISLSWDLPLPGERNGVITGYVINITNLDTEVIQNASSTATIDDLRPFTMYVIKIAARTAAGIGPFSGVVSVQTFEDVPSGPPQMFNGSVNSPRSITFSWTAPPEDQQNGEITNYTLNINETVSGVTILQSTVPSSQTNITITSLQPFTSYSAVIAASTSVGLGPFSTVLSVMTPEDIPAGPPTNLQASNVTATSVSLSWSPPVTPYGNIVSYTVMVQDTNLMVLNVTMASVTVENLLPNRNYSFSVAASTRVGTGPYGVVTAMTSDAIIPSGPPTNITSTAQTASSISLSWDLPLSGERNGVITGYVINITNLDTEVIQNASSTATIDDLRPFTVYVIKIAARTAAGIGPFSQVVSVRTSEDVPSGPPQMFFGSVVSPRSITFSWTAPPEDQQNGEITSYTLCVNETDSGVTILQETVPSSQTNVTITSLQPFTSYSAVIAASTSVGLGPFSTVLSVLTQEDVPSGPPTNINSTALSSSSIFLSWDSPLPEVRNGVILGYIISITNLENGSTQQYVTRSITESTFDSFSPFTVYGIKIAAWTAVGTGPYSKEVNTQTYENVPGPPTDVRVTMLDESSVRLTWSPPTSPNGVIVNYAILYYGYEENNNMIQIYDGPTSAIVPAHQTSFLFENLNEAPSYSFMVRARTAVGFGANSTAVSVVLDPGVQDDRPIVRTSEQISIVFAVTGWILVVILLVLVTRKSG